jgi:uncharacterized protein (TIGR02996 family)
VEKELRNNVQFPTETHEDRLVYADWLEENGRLSEAMKYREN